MKKKGLLILIPCLIICFVVVTKVATLQIKTARDAAIEKSETEQVAQDQDMQQVDIDSEDDTDQMVMDDDVNAEEMSVGTKSSYVQDSGVKKYTVDKVSELTKLQVQDTAAYVTVLKSSDQNMKVEIEYRLKLATQAKIDEVKAAIGLNTEKTSDTCKLSLKTLSNGKPFWNIMNSMSGSKSIYLNIKVYMPKNFTNVTVESTTGYIDVSDVSGKLNVSSETGYISVVNTEAQINATTETGYIDFTDVKFVGDCTATSNSGYITSELSGTSKSASNVKMNTNTGFIDCTFTKKLENKADFTMTTTTGCVEIYLDGNNKVSYTTNTDKKLNCKIDNVCKINASSKNGSVSVE